MRFSILLLLASVYTRASFGGTLEVIDYDHQCVIWSNDNHGCTGYSAPFGQLDGDDCSGKQLRGYIINRRVLMSLQN